jgi:NitT/TauT family transport system substrate-binding protein
LGNTQDVAFRYWLDEQGLSADTEGGGDVSIKPQSNSEGLAAYGSGEIDGAWVPEPWVSEYVKKGAEVLLDEATLWPDGQFVTTNIIVRTAFLEQHPDIVSAFLAGHVAALQQIEADPAAAKAAVTGALQSLTGSAPAPDVLDSAWSKVAFTADPLPATLRESAEHAVSVGLLDGGEIEDAGSFDQLYELGLLNEVLAAAGLPEVGAS